MGRSSASISAILIMTALNLVALAAPYTEEATTSTSPHALTYYDIVTPAAISGITSTTNLITLMLTTGERPFTRTYNNYPIPTLPSPSSSYTSDIQYPVTVTEYIIPDSGMVACNTKQANTATGVVGGFIGGSIFGFVLAVLVTATTAILITKHHKKAIRYNQTRYTFKLL